MYEVMLTFRVLVEFVAATLIVFTHPNYVFVLPAAVIIVTNIMISLKEGSYTNESFNSNYCRVINFLKINPLAIDLS